MSEPECTDDVDGCVVETGPISALLSQFVAEWRKDRPSVANRFGAKRTGLEPVGPYEWLAEDTGLPEELLRNVASARRKPVIELRAAEALVASIGEPAMFHNGTLTVRPNPAASAARQSEANAWLVPGGGLGLDGGLTGSLGVSGDNTES